MIAAPCELLPWDSEFFGCRIARVTRPRLDAEAVDALEEWCERQQVDCLYFLADAAGSEAWLTARGFVPVDVRLTLEAPLGGRAALAVSGIRRARPADVPALREIAAVSHRASRFFADGRLAPRAPALYETWIEKSVAGNSGAVFVPDVEAVSGYITCDKPGGAIGQIGLLGVAQQAQGLGFGRRLIAAALDWFAAEGCGVARVVTQQDNSRAVSSYHAAGFRPIRSQQWYHRWFRTG